MKLLLLITVCFSYNYEVHSYLGDILRYHLEESSYNSLLESLNGTSPGEASIWADTVKRTKKYAFSRQLHYMNIVNKCYLDNEINIPCSNKGCIYSAIKELIGVDGYLFHNTSSIDKTKFLLHFLQDITQPLHVCGKSRGGNDIEIIRNRKGRNKTTNMHSLWDSEIPETFISSGNYTPILGSISLFDVVNFNLRLCCDTLYDFSNGYIIFEEYYSSQVVQKMFDNYINLAMMFF